MKINTNNEKARQEGSMMYFLVFLLIVCYTTASLGYYVSQTSQNTSRRADMILARKYAESGVLIACQDLNNALPTNATANIANNMTTEGYAISSWGTGSNLYTRTLTATFPGAPLGIQIYMTNSPRPGFATITAQSTVGPVSESQTVVVTVSFLGSKGGGGAAIIDVNDGTSDPTVSKPDAMMGNVVVSGGVSGHGALGALVVSGANLGMAVMANGMVNVSANANIPATAISQTNLNTVNQIPDYTAQGTANALFDFSQFVALADATTNVGYNPVGSDHFTNLTQFINAANTVGATNGALEGMVVVDVKSSDPALNKLTPAYLSPAGGNINVHGTLFFNFVGADWANTDGRLIISCGMNINAASLGGVVATTPSTYTTGFPPVYSNPTLNPTNANVAPTYQNVLPEQSLPALVYSSGIIDLHGPVNICGVVYTPNYMELEQMNNHQNQYIRGSIIVGGGIYVENLKVQDSTTTISYDPNTLNNLATINNIGQLVEVAYWQ